jgi:thymidylate synthase ThyX
MKIIEQSWEWVRKPTDALQTIERCGRVAYKSEDKITPESAAKFVAMLIRKGHESVLEHASATVKLITNRGCCYSADTEVLTKDGWKLWPHVVIEDKLACLTDDGFLEWNSPIKLHMYNYNEKMLHFENSSINLLVTPNHNMWVFDYDKRSPKTRIWKFLPAENLNNKRYMLKKNAKWVGTPVNFTIEAHPTKSHSFPCITYDEEKSGDLLELLGLWVTDGCYQLGNGVCGSFISISQSKPEVISRINYLCNNLGLSCRWRKNDSRIDNLRLVRFVQQLFGTGPKTFTASVPQCIKDASTQQITRFLDGVMAGDGNIHKQNGHRVVYTSSSKFADDLQELWMKIGVSANIRTIDPRDRGCIGHNLKPVGKTKTSYVVSVHELKRSLPLLCKKSARAFGTSTSYNGVVYCAEVPGHRLYVRRNGKAVWCGNSHELIRHRIGVAYTQESTRYCNYGGKDIEFIKPVWCEQMEMGPAMAYINAFKHAELCYNELLSRGATPEQAREVLPNALKTDINVTANMREWRHIFKIRTAKEAHPQMRALMASCLEGFKKEFPVLFDDILP